MTDTDRELIELAAKAAGMVRYNPDTGSMVWRAKDTSGPEAARWNARYANKECGTIDDKGYRRIFFRFDGYPNFRIRVHRLAWFISFGALPSGDIDHINQQRDDNRISNLRDVSRSINLRNATRRSNNTSGFVGVVFDKQSGKWCAQAMIHKKNHKLGLFKEITEADAAVRKFRADNGFTETHGRIV